MKEFIPASSLPIKKKIQQNMQIQQMSVFVNNQSAVN